MKTLARTLSALVTVVGLTMVLVPIAPVQARGLHEAVQGAGDPLRGPPVELGSEFPAGNDCASTCTTKRTTCDASCGAKKGVCIVQCGMPIAPGYEQCTQKCTSDESSCSLQCQAEQKVCEVRCKVGQ